MPRGRSTRAKSTVVQLDFTGVAGRLPELDEVLLEVDEASLEDGERAQYIKWKFKVPDDEEHAGGVVYHNTSLSEQSLWALRSLLEALQVEIPAEAFDLDLKDMVGAQMMASIIHEDYEGRPQPKISDHWAVEEEPAKPEPAKATTRRGRSAAAAAEPEAEDKPATARSSRRAAKAEVEAEPEAKAAPARRGAKPAAKVAAKTNGSADTITQADINDMSQEELDDVIAEFKLDVDLSEFKTLRRMRTAVVDAAETAEVLAD
jgi:hypothetical protein